MSESPANALAYELDELLDEVAAAWELDRDYRVAVHLAATYPDAADEIYALLESLVDSETAPTPATEDQEGTARELRAVIENRPALPSIQQLQPALPPTLPDDDEPLIDYAVETTGLRPSEIADALGVTASFLDDVNTHPEAVPAPARAKIVDLAEARLALDRNRVERALASDPRERMAACRHGAFTTSDVTYSDIVARSGMTEEQKREWDFASAADPPRAG